MWVDGRSHVGNASLGSPYSSSIRLFAVWRPARKPRGSKGSADSMNERGTDFFCCVCFWAQHCGGEGVGIRLATESRKAAGSVRGQNDGARVFAGRQHRTAVPWAVRRRPGNRGQSMISRGVRN